MLTGTVVAGLASTASATGDEISNQLKQNLFTINATNNNDTGNKQVETDSQKQQNQENKPIKGSDRYSGTYVYLSEQKPEQKQEGIFSKIKNGITSAHVLLPRLKTDLVQHLKL